jgi:hypothetical protein
MSVMNYSFEKYDKSKISYVLVTIKQWMSIFRCLVVALTSTQYTSLIFSRYHEVCH